MITEINPFLLCRQDKTAIFLVPLLQFLNSNLKAFLNLLKMQKGLGMKMLSYLRRTCPLELSRHRKLQSSRKFQEKERTRRRNSEILSSFSIILYFSFISAFLLSFGKQDRNSNHKCIKDFSKKEEALICRKFLETLP